MIFFFLQNAGSQLCLQIRVIFSCCLVYFIIYFIVVVLLAFCCFWSLIVELFSMLCSLVCFLSLFWFFCLGVSVNFVSESGTKELIFQSIFNCQGIFNVSKLSICRENQHTHFTSLAETGDWKLGRMGGETARIHISWLLVLNQMWHHIYIYIYRSVTDPNDRSFSWG